MSRGENEEAIHAGSTSVENVANHLNAMALADACAPPSSSFTMPVVVDLSSSAPPELRAMWGDADSSDVPVRGESYLEDQVKVAAGRSVASLLHVDLWTTATPEARQHAARFDLMRGDRSILRTCAEKHPDALVFMLNILLPDTDNVSLVSYWLVPQYKSQEKDGDPEMATFYRLLRRFCDGEDDTFRDQRFKLIPSFTQAPWIINSLVQSRPALTGKKLTQTYHRGHNYVEVDMDISSSTVAHYIGSLCQSWATYIEVDVFVTVQGQAQDELPERILGGVRLTYLDQALAQCVDTAGSSSGASSDDE